MPRRSRTTEDSSKQCQRCGVTFTRAQLGIHGRMWTERKFCGRVCAHKARPLQPKKPWTEPLKPCQACGKEMQPKAAEQPYAYRERKTCDKTCGYELLRIRQREARAT